MTDDTGRTGGAPARNPRIVVGVDGSEGARTALRWALEDAGRRDAEVQVVAVVPVDYDWTDAYLGDPRHVASVVADTESRARTMVADVAGPTGPSVSVMALPGGPAERLVELSTGADLLVVGSSGRGALRSAVLGSVALQCTAHARCAVVVVHPRAQDADVPARVVVGLDASDHARAALRAAVARAAPLGARVDAVLAYEAPDHWADLDPVMLSPMGENAVRARERGEAIVAEVLGPGPIERDTVRVVAVEGQPRSVLVREAAGAHLLVVGSRSRNALAGIALGSVALHCAAAAPCPVLVVHAGTDRDAARSGAAASVPAAG